MAGRAGNLFSEILPRVPLGPYAAGFSAGIFLAGAIPLPAWAGIAPAILLLGAAFPPTRWRAPLICLALLCLGHAWAMAASHIRPDGLFHRATDIPSPTRLRGFVVDGPWQLENTFANGNRMNPGPGRTEFLLEARSLFRDGSWKTASGRVRVSREGGISHLSPGMEVELVGLISLIPKPMNPGETDFRANALRQGIQANLRLSGQDNDNGPVGDILFLGGRSWSLECTLARIRIWGANRLRNSVSPDVAELAAALVLGDTRQVDREDWTLFQRTGVVHVLAISGQHLVLVAWCLFILGRLVGFRTRQMVMAVAMLVLVYALVTGGRPPALRAAVTVLSGALAWLSRRPVSLVNSLALSWLVVAILTPNDLDSTGCLLSFLATGLLLWATQGWRQEETEEQIAYEKALAMSRPPLVRWLLPWGTHVGEAYRVNGIVWLGLTPLVAARTYLVSLAAVVVGPPVAILGGWALGTGFLLLLTGPKLPVVSGVLSSLTSLSLQGCRMLSHWGEQLPGGWFYTPGPGPIWLLVFHAGLLVFLAKPQVPRFRYVALAVGVLLILAPLVAPHTSIRGISQPGWRCGFLAIGHGGCTVVELTDNQGHRRVILVDVGASSGDGLTRRVVEPYLRQRGITHVDDLIITHADLDHYSGVPELVNRVPVGAVWIGPHFQDKETPAATALLDGLKKKGIQPGLLHRGARLNHGDCQLEVLYPDQFPEEVPANASNEISLAIRVQGPGGSVILPGDLEGRGMRELLDIGLAPSEVLQAPHHGSRKALPPGLLRATQPQLLVAQQGGRDTPLPGGPFTAWSTRVQGAIEVRETGEGLEARAFATGEIWKKGP